MKQMPMCTNIFRVGRETGIRIKKMTLVHSVRTRLVLRKEWVVLTTRSIPSVNRTQKKKSVKY